MPLSEITEPGMSPRCMRCMLDKYLDAAPKDLPWQERSAYMREVLFRIAELADSHTAPEISHELGIILDRHFSLRRDFSEEKRHFNELVLSMEDELKGRIAKAADPLELSLRMALVGNFIDFGPTGDVSEKRLLELVRDAAEIELDEDAVHDVLARMRRASTIAYLTDNCGEVVLDKLLISQILDENPSAEVLVIVRGEATSNDATLEDARQVGLDEVARTIGNGSGVAGTCPSRVNDETRRALAESDLVISKGLANFETLSGRGENTYFLFLCKCPLYVEAFGVPLYTAMVRRGI